MDLLIRSPDAGKGQFGGNDDGKANLEKLARNVYDSGFTWDSECPLRECCLGMDLGGH